MTGAVTFSPGIFGRPHWDSPDWELKDPTQFPLFPLVLIDDVPLVLVRGYDLAGAAEMPINHLNGPGQARPMAAQASEPDGRSIQRAGEAQNPNSSARIAAACPEREFGNEDMVVRQVLVVDGYRRAEPLPEDDDEFHFPRRDSGLILDAAAAKLRGHKIHWDARQCCYVFADGSIAPRRTCGWFTRDRSSSRQSRAAAAN